MPEEVGSGVEDELDDVIAHAQQRKAAGAAASVVVGPQVGNALAAAGSGAFAGAGGGGGGGFYEIATFAELDGLIAKWEEVQGQIEVSGRKIETAMRQVLAPADDGASKGVEQAAKGSLELAMAHNRIMHQYTQAHIRKLRAAKDGYQGAEGDNANMIRVAGRG